MHFHPNPLPNELVGDHSLAVDGQHGSVIQPSVWPTLLALSPYPNASEEIGPQGTDCWVVGHSDRIRRTGRVSRNYRSFEV